MLEVLFGMLMFLTAVLLILLILVQRGRGGGLTGALGGMGGQSAFGTKAGDLFTRITMFLAAFWIVLCIAAILVLNRQGGSTLSDSKKGNPPEFTVPADSEPSSGPAKGATGGATPEKSE
jgi:preprotein translocase subunit SecG